MKVGQTSGQLPEHPELNKRIKAKDKAATAKAAASAKAAEGPEFSHALLDATRSAASRALDQVMEELSRQGERLAAAQNFEELEKYKNLVQEFLRQVTKGVGRLHFSDGGAGTKAAKVHVILEKVDLQLDALAKDVLGRQSTTLRILERLDQIRGLLLDLYK